MRRGDALTAVLALLLVLPSAQAASLSARLWFDDAPLLVGEARLTATEGSLALQDAIRAGGVSLSWERAEGVLQGYAGRRLPHDLTQDDGPRETPLAYGAARLEDLACGPRCAVLLVSEGGALFGLSGPASGAPATPLENATGGEIVLAEGSRVELRVAAPRRVLEEAPGAGVVGGPQRAPFFEGRGRLLLWDATATLRAANGTTETLWTGERASPVVPGAVEAYDQQVILLDVEGVRLDAPVGAPVVLRATGWACALHGSLDAARASGWISSDGERRNVQGESVRLQGAIAVALRPAGAAEGPADPEGLLDERLFGHLDAQGQAWVGGEPVGALVGRAATPAVAVAGAGLVLVLAAALLLRAGALAALYTRVSRGRVLDNATRLAAYEHIVENPGAHVAQISRALDVGRVVLQHHLRMLEAHRLVVGRPLGRVRAYYAVDAAPQDEALRAEVALKAASRSRVLAEVASVPMGLSQKEIVERTGLSQRLVSYHLARLEETRLVEGQGTRPRRFVAVASAAHPSVQARS